MTTPALPIPSPSAASVFSEEQWRNIQALLDGLDEHQCLWLSGFLAARRHSEAKPTLLTSGSNRIWIAYGSETGNCESLARQLGEKLSQQSIQHQVVSLADVKLRALTRVDYLLIICSTHGDGDPPEPVTGFFDGLMSEQAPGLTGIAFAVLALGDSTYEQFCTAGKALDERLEQLGARRLVARRDCDVDFEQPARQWMDNVLRCLPSSGGSLAVEPTVRASVSESVAGSHRQNPLIAEVLDNIRLSHDARAKPIHHLELLIEPGKLQLNPGDAVGVLPHNPPDLVATVLNAARVSGDEPVKLNQHALPLVAALREHLDLCIPGEAFLKAWAVASGSVELRRMCEVERKVQRQFLRSVQIVDLLRNHPGNIEAQAFADCLRPLQPRLYDVANEITADTDELHLTVKDFQYTLNDREFNGIASQYLLHLQPGERLSLYPHHNKRFRLPDENGVPLILVASGTGIAPFRAFLQSLSRQSRDQDCWLIFQEASAEEDFLYQVDIQQAAARGVLGHVDTHFTSEQSDRQLSDILCARGDRFIEWLKRGAHLYICGEKTSLGQFETTLQLLCEQDSQRDIWPQLTRAKRIHRNLY